MLCRRWCVRHDRANGGKPIVHKVARLVSDIFFQIEVCDLISRALHAHIPRTERGAWQPASVGDNNDIDIANDDDNDDNCGDVLITGAGQTYAVGTGVMSIITSEYVGFQICLWQVRLASSLLIVSIKLLP